MSQALDGGSVEHRALKQLRVGRHSGTLATRILAVAIISALLSSAVSLVVAFPLVSKAAENQARRELSKQADVVSDLLEKALQGQPVPGHRDDAPRFNRDVVVVPIDINTVARFPLTESDIEEIVEGHPFSSVRTTADGAYYLEGRPVGVGRGIVLLQHSNVARDAADTLLQRLLLAVLIGLAFASAVALYVARRTARPLRNAAAAATRLAAGQRDVDVVVEGAEEVADIARAINLLAANLAASEDRQRDFLMSVSHELRTPMTAVRGYAEALADGVIDADDIPATGNILMNETGRLDRLIADLLDLARAGAVDFRLDIHPTDVLQEIREASEPWQLRCEREGLTFSSMITEGVAISAVDAMRLRQIVDNLLENAVRVTPSGGCIQLSAVVDEDQVRVSVEDNGPGLSDEDIQVAFQPAVLHSRYRGIRPVGTGLGLALVGRLVERMNGMVTADHSPLGGARFQVSFPLSERQSQPD